MDGIVVVLVGRAGEEVIGRLEYKFRAGLGHLKLGHVLQVKNVGSERKMVWFFFFFQHWLK